MPIGGGFYSEEQAENFATAGVATQFGAPTKTNCGARNRRGSVCARPPIIEGRGRCLLHCGPKAAGEYRERQHRAYLNGSLSYAEWTRQETQRATNRLGDRWKRNPWLPGNTIDLGQWEASCREDLLAQGLDVDAMAPAVADWLRWRYRRLQIDRTDDRAWARVLQTALPERTGRAGVKPEDEDTSGAVGGARTWVTGSGVTPPRSKRGNSDKPRALKEVRGKGYLRPGRPCTLPTSDDDMQGLIALYRENRTMVAPMMEACQQEADRLGVLRALRAYVKAPEQKAARERWLTHVRLLRPT